MTDSGALPGLPLPCPSCGSDVDLTGASGTVACPLCATEIEVVVADVAADATTVDEVLADLRDAGYETEMAAAAGERVLCGACGVQLQAAEAQVDDVRRATQGDDDTMAVAALTCPNCGARGHLVLDYGADGDPAHAALLSLAEWGHLPA
jgi:uncharacterized Zn finger protein (UPF0148 family)